MRWLPIYTRAGACRLASGSRSHAAIQEHPVGSRQRNPQRSDPGIVIPELARAAQINPIVMGTLYRTGLLGFFIANTAETVLQQIGCSVLTVKPDGSLSPVTLDVS